MPATRGGALAVLAPLAAFTALALLIASNRHLPWDVSIETALSRNALDQSHMDRIASLIGRTTVAIAGCVVIMLAWQRRIRDIAFWAVAVGGTLALDPLLKNLIQRPAIDAEPGDYSFPSGSAMISLAVVIALVLTVPASSRALAVSSGAAFVVGYGVFVVAASWHYPSDIVAGWCVAAAWVAATWIVVQQIGYWRLRSTRRAATEN